MNHECVFYDNKATVKDIRNYLINVADYFSPPLIRINAYADKIRRFAYTAEAYYENCLIGLIACYLNNKNTYEGFITHVSVYTQFHNMGIASHLMDMVFHKASEISFKKIILEVEGNNWTAISFYRRNNFDITSINGTKFIMIRRSPPPPTLRTHNFIVLIYTHVYSPRHQKVKCYEI